MKRIHLTQPGFQLATGQRQSTRPATKKTVPTEFLCELQSAASMVMSREECEALLKELEMLRRPQPVAA